MSSDKMNVTIIVKKNLIMENVPENLESLVKVLLSDISLTCP